MDNDELMSDEQYVRKHSIRAISRILKKFHPEDFDGIYTKILGIYNKHYAPYAKDKHYKKDWSKQDLSK